MGPTDIYAPAPATISVFNLFGSLRDITKNGDKGGPAEDKNGSKFDGMSGASVMPGSWVLTVG
jgi:hypothetical protein